MFLDSIIVTYLSNLNINSMFLYQVILQNNQIIDSNIIHLFIS